MNVNIFTVILKLLSISGGLFLPVQAYVVFDKSGVIRTPSTAECSLSTGHTFQKKWQFITDESSALYLTFPSFNLNDCREDFLAIDAIETDVYCDYNKPCAIFTKASTNITYLSSTKRCEGKFAMYYNVIDLEINVPNDHVMTNRDVEYSIRVNNLPEAQPTLTCSLFFGDGKIVALNSLETSVQHAYAYPGTYTTWCECMTDAGRMESITSSIKTNVEDFLTKETMALSFEKLKFNYGSPTVLKAQHKYVFPVLYQLRIGPVFLTEGSGQFDRDKYKLVSDITALFTLDQSSIEKIGPGEHAFTLDFINSVSSVRHEGKITLTKALVGLEVLTSPYVGIKPQNFTVNIKITHGAPARLTTEVLLHPGNALVSTVKTYCLNVQQCRSAQVYSSVPPSTEHYKVKVTAVNDLTTLTVTSELFRAVPQIIDLKIIPAETITAGKPATFDFYVRGNIGSYQFCYEYEDKSIESQLVITGVNDNQLNFPSLPFDSRKYQHERKQLTFSAEGEQSLKVSIKNGMKQKFEQVKQINVKKAISCMKVDIDDGGNFENNLPIRISSKYILRTKVDIECVTYSSIEYSWKIYKITPDAETPNSGELIDFNGDTSNPEVVIYPVRYDPGFYAVVVTVLIRTSTDKILEEDKDSARIEIMKQRIDVKIIGGAKREIGKVSEVIFEAVVIPEETTNELSYNWLCATSKEDLPLEPDLGNENRKGSCFGTDPLTIGQAKTVTVTRFKTNSRYFIRLFVTGNTVQATLADQEVVTLSPEYPELSIRCLTNCKSRVLSQRPILLQVTCDDCARYTWYFHSKVLSSCENKAVCKVRKSSIAELGSNPGKHSVECTGTNSLGYRAVVSYSFEINSPPIYGSCSVSPKSGISYKTKFTLSCQQPISDNGIERIKYNFWVSTITSGKYLAQSSLDNSVQNIYLPKGDPPRNDVNIIVELCSEEGSCNEHTLYAKVLENLASSVSGVVNSKIDSALKAKDLQGLLQTVVPASSDNAISPEKRGEIISTMEDINLVTFESGQQMSELLDHVTNHPSEISTKSSELAWDKLTELKDFVKDSDSEADVTSTVTSSINAISNLMQSPSQTLTKQEETARLSNFAVLLMNDIVPGESPKTFETSATKTTIVKLDSASADYINNINGDFQAPSLTFDSDEVINVEVDRYNTKKIDFGTADRQVDHVTAISLTSGVDKPEPILSGNARKVPITFKVSQKPSMSPVFLKPTPNCNETYCGAVGMLAFNKQTNDSENLKAAFVVIEVDIDLSNTTGLTLELFSADANDTFTTSKTFTETPVTWTLPYLSIPTSIRKVNVSITAALREQNIITKFLPAKVVMYLANCLFWNDVTENWDDKGCKPNTSQELPNIMCKCEAYASRGIGRSGDKVTQFTPALYASRLVVYPNSIEYEKLSWDIWGEFIENPIVFIVLLVLFTSYFTMFYFAKRSDIRMFKQEHFSEVCDNSPTDSYRYYITVFTGNTPKSGSTGIIGLTMFGSKHTGPPRTLQSIGESVFTHGSVRSFLIKTKESIGDVNAVSILRCHDATSSDWYLQRIVVRDLETNQCCFFVCNTWIADDEEKVFHAAKLSELSTFSLLIRCAAENQCRDRHIWLTVAGMRPWHQLYMTRVQRLSACFLLLFLITCTTIMFVGRSSDEIGFKLQLGEFALSWSNVVIGLESAILSIPMTLVVTSIFRLSRTIREEKARKKASKMNNPKRSRSKFSTLSEGNSKNSLVKYKTKEENGKKGTKQIEQKESKKKINVAKSKKKYEQMKEDNTNPMPSSKSLGNMNSVTKKVRFDEASLRLKDKKHQPTKESRRRKRRHDTTTKNKDKDPICPFPAAGYQNGEIIEKKPIRSGPFIEVDPFSVDRRPLPGYCIVFAWFLIFISMTGVSAIATVYGMSLGVDLCKRWVVSLLCSVGSSIVIIEPAKVFLISFIKVKLNPRLDLADWLSPLPDSLIPLRKPPKTRQSTTSAKYKKIEIA